MAQNVYPSIITLLLLGLAWVGGAFVEHENMPIQLDLWGNEIIFRGKGQTTLYGYPKHDK
jgi:hypothetical protein